MNFNLVEMYNGLLRFNKHILNFFGDIWTFVRDVVIINHNANYNSVYLLKKRC